MKREGGAVQQLHRAIVRVLASTAKPAALREESLGRRDIASAGNDGARTIHLEAREVSWELAPGKTVKAMAYNALGYGYLVNDQFKDALYQFLKVDVIYNQDKADAKAHILAVRAKVPLPNDAD